MIAAYDPARFDGLASFGAARELLAANQESLTELGKVICRYGLEQMIGLSLLHKHFPLASHERLVEEVGENESRIMPEVVASKTDLPAYMWKAEEDPSNGEWAWYPLEFLRAPAPLIELSAEQQPFLNDMAHQLAELDLADVFGITAFHRQPIAPGEGEIMLETTDHDRRVLTLLIVPEDTVDMTTVTETSWQFTPVGNYDVTGNCRGHCISHCFGHNPS